MTVWPLDTLLTTAQTLTVAVTYDYTAEWNAALQAFAVSHPGVKLVFKQYSSLDTLKLAIMADEDDLDILLCSSYIGAPFEKEGIAEDLLTLPAVVEALNVDGFSKEVIQITEKDGKLFAMPVDPISPFMCKLHVALIRQLGQPLPSLTWTWEDLEPLADAAQRAGCYLLDSYGTPWLESFLESSGATEGNTQLLLGDEFKQLCSLWKDWYDRGLIAQNGESDGNALIQVDECNPSSRCSDDQVWYPLPGFNSCQMRPGAYCNEFFILSSSQHKTLAAELLSTYLHPDTLKNATSCSVYYYPDPDHFNQAGFLKERMGDEIILFNEEALTTFIAQTHQAFPRGRHQDMLVVAEGALKEYLEQGESLESFVQNLSNQLTMMALE